MYCGSFPSIAAIDKRFGFAAAYSMTSTPSAVTSRSFAQVAQCVTTSPHGCSNSTPHSGQVSAVFERVRIS